MIISRTPYRISFFGGGCDYEPWYSKHGGAVLSTTINHHAYITVRYLPPFHPEKSRIVWSKIEAVKDNDDIEHPSVRAVLQHLKITDGVELHHTGDLPARSGLGSSSTFTVGALNALSVLQGKKFNKAGLALEAIYLERDVMKENVGIQDQIAAAYGGMNHTQIFQDGSYIVSPVPDARLKELQDHLLLFFTGVSRTASNIAAEQTRNTASGENDSQLRKMQDMVGYGIEILTGTKDICEFGKLLDWSWRLKQSLASNISTGLIDVMYNRALNAGAIGGKVLGAGGGGFMLFFAKPEDHDKIRVALSDYLHIPFKFENEGSKVIYGV